jgi:hypothetical protein
MAPRYDSHACRALLEAIDALEAHTVELGGVPTEL